jgi:hypothetical protein
MTNDIYNFPLVWRWTEETHVVLPDLVLAQLKPLATDSSVELDERLKSSVTRDGLMIDTFDNLREHDASQSAEDFLISLGIEDSCNIFLSWDSKTAIKTTWCIFKLYWDDFCYPASDDIYVTPDDDLWLLFYHHEEIFEFGIRKGRTSTFKGTA